MMKLVIGGIVFVGVAVVSLVMAGAKQETSSQPRRSLARSPAGKQPVSAVFAAGECEGPDYQAGE